MTPQQIDAMKLALEALTYIYTETTADEDELIDQAITAIKEVLAQEQDGQCKRCTDGCPACDARKLLAQRTWVDLTDTQIEQVYFEVKQIHLGAAMPWGQVQFGRALLEKFKEVNK